MALPLVFAASTDGSNGWYSPFTAVSFVSGAPSARSLVCCGAHPAAATASTSMQASTHTRSALPSLA